MDVTFRQARPEDRDSVLPLIYSSGPAEFDYVFAQRHMTALDFLRWAFGRGTGSFGYRNYTVAVVDEVPVGIGAFCSRSEEKAGETRVGLQMLLFYGPVGAWAAMRRGTRLRSIMPFTDADTEFFSQIGVAEPMRGQGVGAALLRRQIAVARDKGRRGCALDVASTNPRAQAFYERLGFTVTAEHRWPYPRSADAVPDQRRMELDL
jgi:ribosomal protein S18 acetylase RimI-like enzyme